MKLVLFIAVMAIGTGLNFAQNWTGAVNADFNNAANWDQTPQNGDDIVINPTNFTGAMVQPVISSNANFSPAGVEISGGGQLTINANLTTTDRIEVFDANSAIIVNAGTFNVAGGAGNARLIFFDGSRFEMNGGNLQVGQRLLIELGAFGVQNGGTINVVETFALIDGNIQNSSYYLLNNGSLTTASFSIENEAGLFYPYFHQSLGQFTVTGDVLFLGVAPGAGRGTMLFDGGEVRINGLITNDPTSTMNFSMKFRNGLATDSIRVASTSISMLAGDSLLLENNSRFHAVSNLTLANDGVLTGDNAWFIAHNATLLTGTGIHQFPSLELRNTLVQSTPAVIKINGDLFKPNGVYVQSGKELELNGTGLQQLTLSGTDTWANLRINNSGPGIVLTSGNLAIDNNVYWNQGVFQLNTSELRFGSTALSNNPSDNSYAIGKVIKSGNAAFVFPVGADNQVYRPFSVSAPLNTNTQISVLYHPTGYSTLTPVQNPLSSVSALEYWAVEQLNSTDPVTVELGWNDAAACGFVDCPSLAIAQYNGTQWDFVASTTSGQCSGANPGSILSNASVSNLSYFTFGFTQGVYQQLVHLCFGDSVQVGANYYSQNGTYFDVFQDQQGQDSTIVTTVSLYPQLDLTTTNQVVSITANAGVSQLNLNPTFSWYNCTTNAVIPNETAATYAPSANGSYAVIVSIMGCADTSACELISQLSMNENALNSYAYPNPTQGDFAVIGLSENAHLQLTTLDGRTVAVSIERLNEEWLICAESISKGVYVLLYEQGDAQGAIQLVIQ